ncbi:TetR/AcrR family transcriptional regulator [Sphingomonas sp. HF-S3]|uniref:TetR/AcrR family transcriptional regulator n=1 Tax=Sphingomonas rustica TaxID=3103142 RepID=A0ABV0BFA5_9SPHN
MKVSREKARENHERVIDTAATLLRERGYDGIGVADLMKAAGLTHGGFYRNFASKDDLLVQATRHALDTSRDVLAQAQAESPEATFRALVERYVSSAHCDDAGGGCILPALAADAARRDDPALRQVFADAVAAYLRHLATLAPPAGTDGTPPRPPAAILAEMVGAVVLARALGEGEASQALLDEVVDDLAGKAPRG